MATGTDVTPPPLRFHTACGRNVRLSSECQQARRINTSFFSRGLVFTSRPVRFNEKISVKLLDLSDNLGGFLYVGFTSKGPERYHAYSDLKNRPGYWAWFFPKQLCTRNSVLFFYYTITGEVHYGVDGIERGTFQGNIRAGEKIWALIDIFGNCDSIKMIESQTVLPKINQESGLRYQGKIKFLPMALHQTHSKCIGIGLGGNYAQRTDSRFHQGYIFTSRTLNINEKVVLQVVPREVLSPACYLTLGLTSCNPALVVPEHLPMNAHNLADRSEYWVVLHDFSKSLSPGDEISLGISQSGEVRVELNGFKSVSIVHVDETQKLWLVINVYGGSLPLQLWSATLGADAFKDSADKLDKECMVCYENVIDTVLYRCGHMCMCYDCAVQQWQGKGHGHCPLCRAIIRDVIKINSE